MTTDVTAAVRLLRQRLTDAPAVGTMTADTDDLLELAEQLAAWHRRHRQVDYDRDPAALAWARAKVQREVDRMADFERQATERGTDPTRWRMFRNMLRRQFIGGQGCVVAAFDERLPEFRAQLDTGTPVSVVDGGLL